MAELPQAVFFDFDGVILESADIKTEAFPEVFSDYPQHQGAIRQHHLNNLGVSRFKKFEWVYECLLQKPLSEAECIKLGQQFSNLVFQKVIAAPFVAGAMELLQFLKGRVTMFVVSGTPEEELIRIVTGRQLSEYFLEVRGTPSSKIELTRELLERYHLDASQCYFIGDGSTDFEAARETGVPFIGRVTEPLNNYWSSISNIWKVNDLNEVKAKWIV